MKGLISKILLPRNIPEAHKAKHTSDTLGPILKFVLLLALV